MSQGKHPMIHFEGTFLGLYRIGTSLSNLGLYDFRKMEWEFIEIHIEKQLTDRDVESEKVLDYQYLPILFSNARSGLFRSPSAEIVVREDRFGKFAPDLHDVVLTGHTGVRQDSHSPVRFSAGTAVSYDFRECRGRIRFSVPNPKPPEQEKKPEPITPQPTETRTPESIRTTLAGGAVDTGGVVIGTDTATPIFPNRGRFTLPDPVAEPTGIPTRRKSWQQKLGGCISTVAGLILVVSLFNSFPILGLLALALLLSYLMRGSTAGPAPTTSAGAVILLAAAAFLLYRVYGVDNNLFNGLLLISLVYLFTRGSRSGFWRTVVGLLMLLAVLAVGASLFGNLRNLIPEPEDGDESSVRLREVRPVPNPDFPDSIYFHEINWEDFVENHYTGEYSTTLRQVTQSHNFHTALADMEVPEDVVRYWRGVYQLLSRNDGKKMDSLTTFFKNRADSLSLNPAQQAEMVVSFIQQIPYYLVHEGTCDQAVEDGNDFVVSYHRQGKPCVPNAVAGVQSPYEFIHDLRGDCDTRTLMAWTILSAMDIPSSVWISQTYGHSVLGVGVPAGGNNYKTVHGIRHFAVELTAEGYRLGMISPDQTDMDNWQVIVHKNF